MCGPPVPSNNSMQRTVHCAAGDAERWGMKASLTTGVSLLLLAVATGATAWASPTFTFDRALAIELATAYSKAYLRKPAQMSSNEIDWTTPIVRSAVHIQNRQFIFVGFRAKQGRAGVFTVLENCHPFPQLSELWGSADIDADLTVFPSTRGTTERGHPGGCGQVP